MQGDLKNWFEAKIEDKAALEAITRLFERSTAGDLYIEWDKPRRPRFLLSKKRAASILKIIID